MFMDYRPRQPGEDDFTYAARIMKATGTEFEAMLANGSFSLHQLREMRARVGRVFAECVDKFLEPAPALTDGQVRRIP